MYDIGSVLTEAAERAFEELGFLIPALDDSWVAGPGPGDPGFEKGADAGVLDGAVLKAMRVAFRGPTGGALLLRGEDTLVEALAANMLGAEGSPPLALQMDALGEIANVVCGNVLPVAMDPVAVFLLDAPAESSGLVPGPGERVRGFARLRLEEGIAEVVLLELVP